ncbi:MAG: DUF6056 family protein [Lachnospiraceae bacterium]
MIKKLQSDTKFQFYLIIFIVFGVMLILNILTPMIADDYNYSFSFSSGAPITNISQIVSSMNGHYYNMNGRIYAHSIAQFMLLIGMPIFDVLNTLVFLLLGYCIYKIAVVDTKYKPSMLAIIYTTMFMCIPGFGQTSLWLVGSCNYLWTITTMILFIMPYRFYILNQKPMHKALILPFLLLAFCSGGCNENTSGGVILCVIFMLCYMLYSKIKVKIWMLAGLCSSIAGFYFMISAPANASRMDQVTQDSLSLMLIKDRFVNATMLMQSQMGKLVLAVVCMFVLAYYYKIKKENVIWAAIFFITALASNYAMILSPTYPSRAFMGVEIFMIITGIILFYSLTLDWMIIAKRLLITYLAVQFLFQFIFAFDSILTTYVWYAEREVDVAAQIDAGVSIVETYTISSDNRYSVFYNLDDLFEESSVWSNQAFSSYHYIQSVTATSIKEN